MESLFDSRVSVPYHWLFDRVEILHGYRLDVGHELLKESRSRFAVHGNTFLNKFEDLLIQTKKETF